MTIKVHPFIAGSNAPFELQLLDASTDAAINLTGCTGFSASARHTETGVVVNMESVVVTSAVLGKLRLEWAVDAFTVAGTYSVQIAGTDATGHAVVLPSEAGQLLFRVGAKNA